MKKYGTPYPKRIPLENIKGIPIAIFAGKQDSVVPIEGNQELLKTLLKSFNNPVVSYEEIDGDHMTFVLGKDLSYFQKVMKLVEKYSTRNI